MDMEMLNNLVSSDDAGTQAEDKEEPTTQEAPTEAPSAPSYLELDGEKYTHEQIKTWRESGLRQDDYTRKTQELSTQRKQFENQLAAFHELNERFRQDSEWREKTMERFGYKPPTTKPAPAPGQQPSYDAAEQTQYPPGWEDLNKTVWELQQERQYRQTMEIKRTSEGLEEKAKAFVEKQGLQYDKEKAVEALCMMVQASNEKDPFKIADSINVEKAMKIAFYDEMVEADFKRRYTAERKKEKESLPTPAGKTPYKGTVRIKDEDDLWRDAANRVDAVKTKD